MTTQVTVESQNLLDELTEEHRRLDEAVRAFERALLRGALSTAEQIEYSRLKKQKLRTKDRIARLQP